MRFVMGAVGLALLAAPALAEDAASAPVAREGDRIICKKERPTGSRIPTRVCMTKDAWEAGTDATREALRATGGDRSMGDRKIGAPGVGN